MNDKSEIPAGKPYDGPVGVAREADFLNSEDLIPGKDQVVKIEKVLRRDNVKFKGGKGPVQVKPVYLSLKFEGKARELGLNRTNTKILSKMFGSVARNWVGKSITLYVTQCLAFGETVDCVRVRDMGSRAATPSEQFLEDHGEDDLQTTGGPTEVNGTPAAGATAEQVEGIFGK